jgi:hypothetical protein
LTQEEYAQEANDYTQKALEELKQYCKSPQCNTWRVVSRVKSPDRLAKFIQDESHHLDESELLEYEKYSISQDLIDEDDDDDNYDE